MWVVSTLVWLRRAPAFDASVGRKLLVTCGLVFPFHFIERIAREHTRRAKPPVTFGAAEALKTLALIPFQPAWHRCIVTLLCSKVNICYYYSCIHNISNIARDGRDYRMFGNGDDGQLLASWLEKVPLAGGSFPRPFCYS
jgi:hypothetical protein